MPFTMAGMVDKSQLTTPSCCFLNFPDDNQHPIFISIFQVFLVIVTMSNLTVSSYLFTIHFRALH